MKEAVIYCRVSSKRQVKEGHGLDSQETRCREHAKRLGYTVLETFPDKAVSGGKLHRPSFNRLLAYVEAQEHPVAVIIDDISRFSRDIESHWALRRALKAVGGKLESPSVQFGEDAHSILIENLLASVSQHQRQHNGEQTRNRMEARAKNGFWCFPPPPGFAFEKRPGQGKVMARHEPMATIIQTALEGFACGRFETQAEVKRYLEREPDFPKNKRGEVRYEEVVRLLTRPIYAGYIDIPNWGIRMIKGQHEGLVGLQTYQRVQERISEGARVPARKNIDTDFPLRGFVTCADCEKPLTSCWSKSKTGKKHPYYMCFNKECESYRKSIRRDVLEGQFEDVLKSITPAPKLTELARAMFKKAWDLQLGKAKKVQDSLRRELARLETQIDEKLDQIVECSSLTVQRAFERKVEKLEREKLLIEEKLAQKPGPKRSFEQMFELAMRFLASPWNLWTSPRIEDKRTVLKLAFSERLAYSRKTGFRTPKTTMPFNVLGGNHMQMCEVAEEVGFEPTVRFHARRFSRLMPPSQQKPAETSTTLKNPYESVA
ncbi:MAG: recombinase family protein [Paracoccaceae bacterium]|nr:recombinase family protein [Paracoccaceae bacterium]